MGSADAGVGLGTVVPGSHGATWRVLPSATSGGLWTGQKVRASDPRRTVAVLSVVLRRRYAHGREGVWRGDCEISLVFRDFAHDAVMG